MNTPIKNVIKNLLIVSLVTLLFACGGKEERKAAYLEKGKAYLADKNYKKAKIEFKNVLQIDPKFAAAYYYMGQLEEKNKELGKALRSYKKAAELDPEYIEPKIKLAKIYVLIGTDKFILDAKTLLNDVNEKGGANSESGLIAAIIQYKSGDEIKAVSKIKTIVSKNPKLVEGVSLLYNIYIKEGKNDQAEIILLKGVKNNKDNVPLRISLAKFYVKNKQNSKAEKYLKEIIKIDPNNFSLRTTLGLFYATTKQLTKAENIFRQAIKDDDEDVQRYIVFVKFLSAKVSLARAINELKAVINKKPELYELQFTLASLFEGEGEKGKAKKVLIKILSEKGYEPEGISARNKLAAIFASDGDMTEARKYIEEVLDEHPNNNEALYIGGKLSLSEYDAVSAINNLRTVVKNEPKNLSASWLLAQAHELNKESVLAKDVLKKAIEINPADFHAHINYAKYLVQTKDFDGAKNFIDKALVRFKDNYALLDLKLKLAAQKNNEKEIISILDAMERSSLGMNADVYLKKGQYFLTKKNLPEALSLFEKALEKTQKKYFTLKNITNIYLLQKKPAKAIERLKLYASKHDDKSIAQQLLGRIYLYKKNFTKAKKYFKQAIEGNKSWSVPYMHLAASYLAQDESLKAEKVYEQAALNVDDKIMVLMKLAAFYEKNKKYSKAMSTYEKVLEINSRNILAKNNLASLLLDFGAEKDLKKALSLATSFESSDQPALQDTLAWAYSKNGNQQQAIELLKIVIDKIPEAAVFQYHLGVSYHQAGDKKNAKKYLEKAVASKQNFIGKVEAKKILATL